MLLQTRKDSSSCYFWWELNVKPNFMIIKPAPFIHSSIIHLILFRVGGGAGAYPSSLRASLSQGIFKPNTFWGFLKPLKVFSQFCDAYFTILRRAISSFTPQLIFTVFFYPFVLFWYLPSFCNFIKCVSGVWCRVLWRKCLEQWMKSSLPINLLQPRLDQGLISVHIIEASIPGVGAFMNNWCSFEWMEKLLSLYMFYVKAITDICLLPFVQ